MTDNESSVETIRLFPIQRPWIAGALAGMSLGVYLFFYLYVYARDMKQLGKDATPWLWGVSPIIGISTLFTIPRLASEFEDIGKANGASPNNKGVFLGALVFGCFVFSAISERISYELSLVLTVLVMPVIAYAVMTLTADINTAKHQLPDEYFAKAPYTLTVSTWLFGVISVPFSLLVIFGTVSELMYLTKTNLDENRIWPVNGGGFKVTNKSGWTIAELGTHSDGTAILELAQPDNVWAIAFDQKNNTSTFETASFRRNAFMQEHPDGECKQRRWLREGTLELRSEVLCTARFFADPLIEISLSIEDSERHIEMYGHVNSTQTSQAEGIQLLRDLGTGIELVGKDDTNKN